VPYGAERTRDRGSWLLTEEPWDFGEPPAPSDTPALDGADRSPAAEDVGAKSLDGLREQFDQQLTPLVQRVLHSAPDGRLRAVAFSAVGERTGSAGLCAATADALATQTSGSVCLVDANLRSPSVHTLLGVSGAAGFTDLLLQKRDLVSCLVKLRSNLCLLPGGAGGHDAVRRLTAEHLRPLLAELSARFDYVVFDTPAAAAHGDAAALGGLIDGVVLVMEANTTRREVARRIIGHLQAANVTVLGAVLTNRTFPIPEALYRRL
jgi:Mrp family chromosome partitioning ATPase